MYRSCNILPIKLGITPEVFHSLLPLLLLLSWQDVELRAEFGGLGKCCCCCCSNRNSYFPEEEEGGDTGQIPVDEGDEVEVRGKG